MNVTKLEINIKRIENEIEHLEKEYLEIVECDCKLDFNDPVYNIEDVFVFI